MLTFVFVLLVWFFSLCLHEFAHAWVAYKGGDHTVKEKGYLNFNLFAYLNPMTSFIFPILILILGGIGLPGGAVYITTSNIRSRILQSATSLAGPLTNILLACVLAYLLHFPSINNSVLAPAFAFLVLLQISAFVLNMLPIPGFDGFGALAPWLPDRMRYAADKFAPIFMIILLLILLMPTPVAGYLFGFIYTVSAMLTGSFDLIREGWQAFQFWKSA